jgi:cytochrome c
MTIQLRTALISPAWPPPNRAPPVSMGRGPLTESLAEGLSVGHPDMPEFFFEPDDITAILAYLNSIQEQ